MAVSGALSKPELAQTPRISGECLGVLRRDCGTELEIVQEGVPSEIPIENCYLGWQESLSLLAQLVEAEVPE